MYSQTWRVSEALKFRYQHWMVSWGKFGPKSSTTIHILAELMHIAPELLIDRANNPKSPFDATVPADMYALGCVVNQIYFRQPLSDEQTMREFQNNSSK
jgi:hypothetical protein